MSAHSGERFVWQLEDVELDDAHKTIIGQLAKREYERDDHGRFAGDGEDWQSSKKLETALNSAFKSADYKEPIGTVSHFTSGAHPRISTNPSRLIPHSLSTQPGKGLAYAFGDKKFKLDISPDAKVLDLSFDRWNKAYSAVYNAKGDPVGVTPLEVGAAIRAWADDKGYQAIRVEGKIHGLGVEVAIMDLSIITEARNEETGKPVKVLSADGKETKAAAGKLTKREYERDDHGRFADSAGEKMTPDHWDIWAYESSQVNEALAGGSPKFDGELGHSTPEQVAEWKSIGEAIQAEASSTQLPFTELWRGDSFQTEQELFDRYGNGKESGGRITTSVLTSTSADRGTAEQYMTASENPVQALVVYSNTGGVIGTRAVPSIAEGAGATGSPESKFAEYVLPNDAKYSTRIFPPGALTPYGTYDHWLVDAYSAAKVKKTAVGQLVKRDFERDDHGRFASSSSEGDTAQSEAKQVFQQINDRYSTPGLAFADFQRDRGFSAQKLSTDEQEAVRTYAGNHYSAINAVCYSGTAGSPVDRYIAPLDSAIAAAPPLESPTMLYRGVSGDYATTLSHLSEGDVFSSRAFTSTSIDRDLASSFTREDKNPLVLSIEAPTGTPGLSVGGFFESVYSDDQYNEGEFLMPRGTKFEVLSAADAGTMRVRVVNG